MALEEDALVFDVRPQSGSVFTASGTRVFDTDNPVPGKLTINATNSAGKWIDVVVETTYPTWERLWTSGRMEDGQTGSSSTDLRFHTVPKAVKITRWAPGFLGIPGSGGGEINFVLPTTGDVTINFTVTG